MSKHNKLSAEHYEAKFEKLFSKDMNWIPQEDEKIVQCHHPHPPYWFISNKGYLFSVYSKKLKIVKPIFDKTGRANKKGERSGKGWRYGSSYNKSANEPIDRWDMSKMLLEYFGENEFDTNEETEAHHKKKKSNFSENEAHKCNNVDNLQKLPRSVHKELTYFASKTSKEHDEDLKKRIEKSGCPVYQFTQEQLKEIFLSALKTCLDRDEQPIVYTTTLNEDVSKIEAEAHPIKKGDINFE